MRAALTAFVALALSACGEAPLEEPDFATMAAQARADSAYAVAERNSRAIDDLQIEVDDLESDLEAAIADAEDMRAELRRIQTY